MTNVKRNGRLGLLAVGVGIGAALAQTPIASADSSTDWLSSIDSLAAGALPAPSSGLDLAISFDGYSLFSDGSAVADTGLAGNGNFDFAIAYGDGAIANAYGGIGDYALASGTNAMAAAGGGTGADYDSAIDIGNNELPSTATPDGAFAGDADLTGNTSGGTGAYDTAIDIGNNTNDPIEGGDNGASAGAGGLDYYYGDGNNDTAIDFGNNSGFGNGASATDGNGNYASESGSTTGETEGAYAGEGNDNTAVSDISYTSNGDDIFAANGNDNHAYAVGPENTTASADYGDSNISYILDHFGSTASEASSGGLGGGGNSDLAAVLFTDGAATATHADNLYDVVTAAGNEAGTAAATSGGWLAELLSLF